MCELFGGEILVTIDNEGDKLIISESLEQTITAHQHTITLVQYQSTHIRHGNHHLLGVGVSENVFAEMVSKRTSERQRIDVWILFECLQFLQSLPFHRIAIRIVIGRCEMDAAFGD